MNLVTKSSVFSTNLFASYDVSIAFCDRVAGSVPSSPVAVWEMVLRQMMQATGQKREEIDEQLVLERTRKFLEETGKNVDDMTTEDVKEMAKKTAGDVVNVFRRDANGIVLASHVVKAAIKEAVNVLYAKERWGKTGKGPLGYVSERVFVEPSSIPLTRGGAQLANADGVNVTAGTVSGPLGKRAILTQHEYVEGAEASFQLRVLAGDDQQADKLMAEKWPIVFSFMERNGLGSIRKFSGYGTFVTTKFEKA